MTTNERRPIHHASTLALEPSEPGAASTAPALAHTYGRGASVSDRTCSIEGCTKAGPLARGWCPTHYSRWRLHGDPNAVLKAQSTPYGAPLAFVAEAVASATDECIIWPYFIGRNGYGKVPLNGRSHYVHRVVLERAAGPAPRPGMLAAHLPVICHNRACVNPRHLRWATPKQNMDDRVIDGTHHRGEHHHGAKLTAVQVLAIFRDGRTHQAIADEYGVTRTTITMIKLGRTWGWLTHTSRTVA